MAAELERRGLEELAERKGRSRLALLRAFALDWVLARTAAWLPLPSWRTRLHRLRGFRIGAGVYLGANLVLDGLFPEMIEIGDHTSIGSNTAVFAHANIPSDTPLRALYPRRVERVTIGRGVWIMPNVVIAPGVTIGDYAVIALGSVVTSDVPPLSLAAGAPARVVKSLADGLRDHLSPEERARLL